MESWGVWEAQSSRVDPASLVCRCLGPVLVHQSAKGESGSPRGDPDSRGGTRHLITTALAPRRVSPGLERASGRGCSEVVLGVLCHREEDGPQGAGGHPGVVLAVPCHGIMESLNH